MKKMIPLLILFSPLSIATTRFSLSCPNKFIGTVTNVEDMQSSGFAKVEVNFQVIQKIKGDSFTSKKIQVVKDGPIEFKTGETYTIETRDEWLCDATLLTQN